MAPDASPAPAAPPTRAEWVDAQLRQAILRGEVKPGERLHAERLAARWGVSPTPLRETFQRLAGEGLVVIEPQRGARVASIDVDEAVEVYELRLLLDPVALSRSVTAARGDAAYATGVRRALDALEVRHASSAAYHDAHRAFHLALVDRCPNRRLVRQVAQLLEHAQRFHVAVTSQERRTGARLEHRELVDAAVAGDARAASASLRRHLQATLDVVRAQPA